MRPFFFMASLLVVLSSVSATAQTKIFGGAWSSFTVDNGDQPYADPILYASVNRNFRFGLSGGAWVSRGKDGGREFDLLAGWGHKWFSANVGYFIHAGGGSANVVEIDLRTALAMSRTTELYLMVSPILTTNTSGDAGVLVRIGFNHKGKLYGVELAHGGWILYDTGVFKGEEGLSVRYELGVPFRAAGVTLEPLARISMPINMETRETIVIVGLRFST